MLCLYIGFTIANESIGVFAHIKLLKNLLWNNVRKQKTSFSYRVAEFYSNAVVWLYYI